MPERDTYRRRTSRGHASPEALQEGANPVLALQRSIGNRAVAQMLSRTPERKGTVTIPGVGKVKVSGGNLEAWAGKATPDWVDVTSQKGKHSKKLEKAATEGTTVDVTVFIDAAGKEGENLNVGGGTQIEIKGAKIKKYEVNDGVETWRIDEFTAAKRTQITRSIGAG
jgi:hypothetical protein